MAKTANEQQFYYILKDGQYIARTSTKAEAIETIRMHQSREAHHYLLMPQYSYIKGGAENFVKYPRTK